MTDVERDGPLVLTWNGDEVEALLVAAAFEGLKPAGEHLLQVSTQLVPLEEGDLERSGDVTDNGEDTVAVSYDTPYAARQHEELTWRHDEGRQAKYLEQPMTTERDTMLAIAAETARGELP